LIKYNLGGKVAAYCSDREARMTAEAEGELEAGRDRAGRWQKGQSGNPAGRRKGSKNRATLWAEAMVEGELEAVIGAVLERAKEGDAVAQRFCVARLMPAARERRLTLPGLPAPTDWPARDARAAFRIVRAALAAGELVPGEAASLVDFFERGRAVEDAAFDEECRDAEARRREAEVAEQRRRNEEWRRRQAEQA
jgi:uncharacterized protein DUF5681